jgi:hypothetical protein
LDCKDTVERVLIQKSRSLECKNTGKKAVLMVDMKARAMIDFKKGFEGLLEWQEDSGFIQLESSDEWIVTCSACGERVSQDLNHFNERILREEIVYNPDSLDLSGESSTFLLPADENRI